ncbi:rho-associated protein kinase 2-like isoform X2 [Cylas formicarius]|uniref:rho-associated protein kinase 2-like isoform X2 n=1 Tax=Cylas formicarius TaxID=197179 RepID=UPI0029589D04|nr:rho-associated protein kinase 2-like isoform X2 [Cylas formicarius]
MSSSRVIRGTKAKIFLYVCGILIITGLIACYNNTLSQLDEIKKSNEICHQQQENLSTQLQVISDYKQKLEKSLKNEKAEHQYSKKNLEDVINEEKSKSEKVSNDALLKYNSLQQHYNLLKTEHEDFKEASGKIQQKQLDEINSLQSKLKELKEELRKVEGAKEALKTQYVELELEVQKLKLEEPGNEQQKVLNELMSKNHDLQDRFDDLQKKCGSPDTLPEPQMEPHKVLENGKSKLGAPSSSTKASAKSSVSMSGAKPLMLPGVTPETVQKAQLKFPLGVPMVPENRENQNEQPELSKERKKNGADKEDGEKDNGAHEVYDAPAQGPDDKHPKDGVEGPGNTFGKQSDGKIGKQDQEYKDLQREEEVDAMKQTVGFLPQTILTSI